MWSYFLNTNKGSPWRSFSNVYFQADISSDASGKVDFPQGPTMIISSEFTEDMMNQDIQVKEGVALKETLQMLIKQVPNQIKGTNVVCSIDNQALQAIYNRKGT